MPLYNANGLLVRASSAADIMTFPKEGSNLDKYEAAIEARDKALERCENMKKKDGPGYAQAQAAYTKNLVLANDLEAIKDVPNFSVTRLKKLREMYTEARHHRRRSINNKFVRKGQLGEPEGIKTYSIVSGELFNKNDERLSNDFVTGEVDIYTGPKLIGTPRTTDIKCLWDSVTFGAAQDATEVDKTYWWQGQVYMALTGADEHTIAYCLINTPLKLIRNEIYHLDHPYENEAPRWLQIETVANMVYDKKTFDDYLVQLGITPNDKESKAMYDYFVEWDMNERVHEVTFKRDDEQIQELYNEIVICRKWMNESGKYIFDKMAA